MSDKREVSVLVTAAPVVTGRAASKHRIRLATDDRSSKMRKRDPLAEAARWFVDLITAADINQLWPKFEEWLHQDLKNRSAYEEMERTWAQFCSAGAIWARSGVSRGPVMVRH